MEKIGYALVAIATGEIVALPDGAPCRLTVDGVGVVDFDQPGQVMPDADAPTHIFVERWADPAPSSQHSLVSEEAEYDEVSGRVEVTRVWAIPAATVQQLKDYAAEKRRVLERGSTLVDVGTRIIPVWTDPESRGSAMGLVLALNFNPALTVAWKGSDGAFYALTAAELAPLALGMMAYVQSCFDAEAAVMSAIDAETITSFAEIDAADWPGV